MSGLVSGTDTPYDQSVGFSPSGTSSGGGSKGAIAAQFAADDAARTNVLNRARLCAQLTDPSLLPPLGQIEDQKLPENYQSVGSNGLTNIEGKMLLALFPPDRPWFVQELAPQIKFAPVPPEAIGLWEQALFLQDLVAMATLESANPDSRDEYGGDVAGFRTVQRQSISQTIATGDSLERLDDDYRISVFRRDQYVTRRDSCCRVLYHIIRETLDPLSIGQKQCDMAKLDWSSLMKKPAIDRLCPMHTRVEWHPISKRWVIEQELHGVVINTSEEKYSPFFSTPFKLSPGEHYGRGLIERNLGDLRSLDELAKRQLDFAELASKMLPALDYASEVKPENLAADSGKPFRARVLNGVIQDVAMFKVDKLADFTVVEKIVERIERRLSKALLTESGSVRDSERTTAFEVSEVTLKELEGGLGGVYAPISDKKQVPLVNRLFYQLRRDNIIQTVAPGTVKVRTLTGIAALARQAQAARLLKIADVVKLLGDEAIARLNVDVFLDVFARMQGGYEPNLIKSTAQVKIERQQAIALAAQHAATQKAIDVAGNVVENNATQQPQTIEQAVA